ncbi:MAG: RsbRD N-terminal domain-containing protein [Chloroflexi bacterium]|nr:RsbRD N-terminal domain-containing protein [Chloroflexota bacterium]
MMQGKVRTDFFQLLEQKKTVILEKWTASMAAHPPENRAASPDRFANPVDYIVSHELESLYDKLLQTAAPREAAASSLDQIIRIRAVQAIPPSAAVGFVFALKDIVRQELAGLAADGRVFEDLLRFESRLDELTRLAFDIYADCREKFHEVRAGELASRADRALRMLDRLGQAPAGDNDTGGTLA